MPFCRSIAVLFAVYSLIHTSSSASISVSLRRQTERNDPSFPVATLEESWCPGLVTKPEPRAEAWNVQFAKELAREVREADAGEGLELVFYGDSITEQWRGTDQGGAIARATGDAAIFDKYFGSKYRSNVLAVGGDQVGHLLWRLLNGELPRVHQPKLAVVMIGTNDLGAASACSEGDPHRISQVTGGVKNRINATISLLREKVPETQILMLAVLPRGSATSPATLYTWPGVYTPAIQDINTWLAKTASDQPGVHYLDCGPKLLTAGTISPAIFGDGLHPSPAGMLIMAKCIAPAVYDIMGPPHTSFPGRLVAGLARLIKRG